VRRSDRDKAKRAIELSEKLATILEQEPDPDIQRRVVELLIIRYARRVGGRADAVMVAAEIHKRVRKLIETVEVLGPASGSA
jgi:metal-sulfur cluster biosynthetic enzyme